MKIKGCIAADMGKNRKEFAGAAVLKIASSGKYGKIAFAIISDGAASEYRNSPCSSEASAMVGEYYSKWFLKELPHILKEAEKDLHEDKESDMRGRMLTEILRSEKIRLPYCSLLFHKALEKIKKRLEEITCELNIRIQGYGNLNNKKMSISASCLIIMGEEYLIMRIGEPFVYIKESGNLKTVKSDTDLKTDEAYLGGLGNVRPGFSQGKIEKGTGVLLCSGSFVRNQDHIRMKRKITSIPIFSEKYMEWILKSLVKFVRKKGESEDILAVYVAGA